MLFHRVLPQTLWKDGIDDFIEMCDAGEQGQFLLDFWSELMEIFQEEGGAGGLRGAPKVSARSFPLLLNAAVGDHRLIIIGAPPPRMTPQARFIGCWFDSSSPKQTLRYFAAELSVDAAALGDVLGEWTSAGSHRNFDTFCSPGESSAEVFADAIVRLCTNRASTIADVDTRAAIGKKKSRKDTEKNLRREDVRAKIARRARALSEPLPSARSAGPLSWESESARIASDIVGRLRSAQSAGQSVLIASADRANGLRTTVSTYLQFKILNKKKLLAEVQGDYSYWGVSIQSRDWTKFTVLGFSSPSSSNGNFSITYQDFRDDRRLLEWLSHTVAAMQEVLAPEGEIAYKGF